MTRRLAAIEMNKSQLDEGQLELTTVTYSHRGVCFQLPAWTVSGDFSIKTAKWMHVDCNCSVKDHKLESTYNAQGPPEMEGAHNTEPTIS